MSQPTAIESEFIRAFIAVRIPAEVVAQLVTVQDQLKRLFRNVSWTRPEAMHITVHFLGNTAKHSVVDAAENLRELATHHSSFEIGLGEIGSFSQRVLWVGVESGEQALKRMANDVRSIAGKFGSNEEIRAFSAHVTLGRFRQRGRGVERKLRDVAAPRFETWEVRDIEFIRSELSPHGSRYTTLHTIALGSR